MGVYTAGGASLTPALDRFAEECVRFDDASAPMPFTLASNMSLLTGLRPGAHGVVDRDSALPKAVATLPELLQRSGYETWGIVTNTWMDAGFGFGRGFDRYERLPYAPTFVDRVRARADELLGTRDRSRPLFLFLHILDAHSDYQAASGTTLPYYSPPPYREDLPERSFCDSAGRCATELLVAADREDRPLERETLRAVETLYDRGVSYLDRELGRLLDDLAQRDFLDRALVVIEADHGEEFREHGKLLHSQPYRESLAVPLLLRLPGGRSGGTVVGAPVEILDVFPTILEAAGIDEVPPRQGRSLLAALEGRPGAARSILAQDKSRPARFSLRQGDEALVADLERGEVELYDLADDPGESKDIAALRRERVARLLALLRRHVDGDRRWRESLGAGGTGPVLSSEDQEDLRALGYLQ